jgi:hypothetical protein
MYENRQDIEKRMYNSLHQKYIAVLLVMEKQILSEEKKISKKVDDLKGLNEVGYITDKQRDLLDELEEKISLFSTCKADLEYYRKNAVQTAFKR